MPKTFAIFVLFAAAALGDDQAGRRALAGTWSDKDARSQWVIRENGETISMVFSQNDHTMAKLECAAGASDCEMQDAGRKAKVSMWFNGDKLVQMETKGSEVVTRRFSASGDTLEIEVIPIVPDGHPQTLHLTRVHQDQTK